MDAWGLDYKFNHNPNPNEYPFKMSKKLVFFVEKNDLLMKN